MAQASAIHDIEYAYRFGAEESKFCFAASKGRKTETLMDKPCQTRVSKTMCYSGNGKFFAIIAENGVVQIWDCDKRELASTIKFPRVSLVDISPCGTFVTLGRLLEQKNQEPNVVVFKRDSGERLRGFYWLAFMAENWPWVKFSDNDKICGVIGHNRMAYFYNLDNLERFKDRKVHDHRPDIVGVQKISIKTSVAPRRKNEKPGKPAHYRYSIALFKARTKKDQKCYVSLYSYPHFESPRCRTDFLADEAEFKWNSAGSQLLVTIPSKGEKVYYGGKTLLILDIFGNSRTIPVESFQAVEWHPTESYFVLVDQFPNIVRVFNSYGNCSKLKEGFIFGKFPANTLKFSPNGQFLMTGGFGNLSGDMRFWNLATKSRIGACSEPGGKSYEWTPDSRGFVTAIRHPRMVDNRIKIWSYNGELLSTHEMESLYRVNIRPNPNATKAFIPANQIVMRSLETTKRGKVYRPPGAKVLSFKTKVFNDGDKLTKAEIMSGTKTAPVSKKAAAAKPKTTSLTAAGSYDHLKNFRFRGDQIKPDSPKQQKKNLPVASEPVAVQKKPVPSGPMSKNARKRTKKKLKAIQDLKKKAARGGVLSDAEKKMVSNEQYFIDRLALP